MFKICLIGCGNHSTFVYGRALKKYQEERVSSVELAGCCDLDMPRAKKYQETFGFNNAYDDFNKMIDNVKPEALIAILPENLAAGLGVEIMGYKIPLLVEKPPGINTHENITLKQCAKQLDIPHLVNFNRRYTPMLKEVKKIFSGNTPDHIYYGMYRHKRLEKHFYTTAIHAIDAVRFLSGSDYKKVAFTYHEIPGTEAANIYIDGEMATGTKINIVICPNSGMVVECGTIAANNLFLNFNLPFNDKPTPAHKITLARDTIPEDVLIGHGDGYHISGGFYNCIAMFLDDIADKKYGLYKTAFDEALQSSRVAECIANREPMISF